MQGSLYTFRLVQICTPEPCKIVLMTDKRKRRLLCMVQVYKSCVDRLCIYQAFYRICCKQAGNRFTMLSRLDKQLLVKLGGLDTSVSNCCDHQLGSLYRVVKVGSVPAAMLAAFEDIRHGLMNKTVLAFLYIYQPPRATGLCPTQPISRLSADAQLHADDYTVPGDIACLSADSRIQAEALLASCEQASGSQIWSSLLSATSKVRDRMRQPHSA